MTDTKSPLSLDILEVQSCVGSGFCCRVAPCPYGEWNEDKSACKHLVEITSDDEENPRFGCGIYDEIVKQPLWHLCPAFGQGCVSTLFNADRRAILRENADKHGDPFVPPARFNRERDER